MTHTHTHIFGRVPLDKGSVPSQRPLTDNTRRSKQLSMPPAGIETAVPAIERPHTHASNRAATGIGLIGK